MKRKLTKFEYKHILRHQRKVGKDFTKKERSKLKKLTFEDVFISEEGFIILGNSDGTMDISDTGFLLVSPIFRFELVSDPHILKSMHNPASFRRRKVKEPTHIFTAGVHHLLTNAQHKLHPEPPKYTLYQHVFGIGGDYPDQGFFYVGITQRNWQKRWK